MPANILVVDDSVSIRAMVSKVIQNIGYNPIACGSGEEACDIFKEQQIDIVVLDVEMPGINGFETCRRLRKLAENEWFPVIYLSANNSEDYIVEGIEAGGDTYVAKPVSARLLESILKAMGRIADMKNDLEVANKTLEHLAAFDSLTLIPNRRSIDETLLRFTLQAVREKTDLALLLIDIDHFKLYNDNYGHVQGDECLKEFAKLLKQILLRPVDFVGRYGGEEFAILLPATSIEGAEKVATRLIESLKDKSIKHEFSLVSDHLTASIGVSISKVGSTGPNTLIEQADEALYRAKEGGRNQFQLSE